MANWKCKKEVVSFSSMATIEIICVTLSTIYKAAALNGLSFFVLIAYSNLIGPLIFLPLIFIFPREGVPSILNLPILCRFVLLALLYYGGGVCGCKGIEYTSPTIASCISNLIPAFTFVFVIIFRMENMDFRSGKTRAKTVGTIVSISGALITILFKGPVILSYESSSPSFLLKDSMRTLPTSWVIGGLLLVANCIFCSLAYIIQTQIVKAYPNEITVAVVSSILTSIIGAIIGPIVETNQNAWTLKTHMALITVLLFGIFGACLTTAVHTWGLNTKGPLYVSIFKPFSIVIAAVMGVTFLGDDLCLGSLIGAVIILLGFYAVIWGKTEDEEGPKRYDCFGPSSSDRKIPLLTSYGVEDIGPNSQHLFRKNLFEN